MRRRPAAMLVDPDRRRTPMARLQQAAIARAALPVRNWNASSAKVTLPVADLDVVQRHGCERAIGG